MSEEVKSEKCESKCEVYSRIVGYFRPVANWNVGKKEEFKDRLEYCNEKALKNEFEKVPEAVVEDKASEVRAA